MAPVTRISSRATRSPRRTNRGGRRCLRGNDLAPPIQGDHERRCCTPGADTCRWNEVGPCRRPSLSQHLDRPSMAHGRYRCMDRADSEHRPSVVGTRWHRHLGRNGGAERHHDDRAHRRRIRAAGAWARGTRYPWPAVQLAGLHLLVSPARCHRSVHRRGEDRTSSDRRCNPTARGDLGGHPEADAGIHTQADINTAAVELPDMRERRLPALVTARTPACLTAQRTARATTTLSAWTSATERTTRSASTIAPVRTM